MGGCDSRNSKGLVLSKFILMRVSALVLVGFLGRLSLQATRHIEAAKEHVGKMLQWFTTCRATLATPKTIWLFRERLKGFKLVVVFFSRFHEQLAARGYVARAGQLIDATFVAVPRQRDGREENAPIKAGETPPEWKVPQAAPKRRQKDTEARWTQKNHENHYGYKNHINADREHKLVQSYAVTDASVHYRQVFEELLDQREVNGEKRTVHADSAYRSEHKEAWTQAANMPSQICEKGARGHPLTDVQRATNRNQSRIRSRVEYVFAAQAHMGRHFMRTICMLSAGMKIGMTNLVYNMVRMTLLLRRDRRGASAVA